MTDQSAAVKAPLGAGAIIGGGFGVFFARFGVFFLLAFGPIVLVRLFYMLSAGLRGSVPFGGSSTWPALDTAWTLLVAFAPSLIAYALVTALIVLAAYDVKRGRPVRIGACFRIAFARWFPVIIVSVIVYACVALAVVFMFLSFGLLWQAMGAPISVVFAVMTLLALGIPVLYVFAMLSVAITAVVVERIGLRAIGRSVSLTRAYRWPVLGALLVVYIGVFSAAWGLERAMRQIVLPDGFAAYLFWLLVTVAVSCITSGIIAVSHVLIYARLREIKDGVTVDGLAEIFD